MFRDIFKKIQKEAVKRIEEAEKESQESKNEQQHSTRKTETRKLTPSGRYGRLAVWIKSNYGAWFKDGATTEEVYQQLERVFNDRKRKGDFRNNPDILKGFRAYIEGKQYGNLVRVSE